MNVFQQLLARSKELAHGYDTLREWIGDGGHIVDRGLSQKRADTCLKCPKHSHGWGMVEGAIDAIRLHLELKNHLRIRVKGEKKLHVCEMCGCAMRLKVHLPIERVLIEPERRVDYPSDCWLITETQ